jgi:hypothetical protein
VIVDVNMVCLITLNLPICCRDINKMCELENLVGEARLQQQDGLRPLIFKHNLLNFEAFRDYTTLQQDAILKGSFFVLEQASESEKKILLNPETIRTLAPLASRLITLERELTAHQIARFNAEPIAARLQLISTGLSFGCRSILTAQNYWIPTTKTDFFGERLVLQLTWDKYVEWQMDINKLIRTTKLKLTELKIFVSEEKHDTKPKAPTQKPPKADEDRR